MSSGTGREDGRPMISLYSLLPPQVRRRIKALKKLQYETTLLEARYYLDVHRLEAKYSGLYGELFNRRNEIVTGKAEPTDKESTFNEGYESPDDNDPTVKELRSKLSIVKDIEAGATGIPEFWLTVLKNARQTYDLVQSHDEPVLRHLTDVKSTLHTEPMGFTLSFHFADNPFFSNRTLTKEYEMICSVDEASPWAFDGPEIRKARGCQIDWRPGMDVTQKTVHRKDKSRKSIDVDVVKNESFFNFFSPPLPLEELAEDVGPDEREEIETKLAEDYSLGIFMREKLIPQAVLYYTGEAPDDDTSDESDAEDSSEESFEEEEAEEENPTEDVNLGEGEGDAD